MERLEVLVGCKEDHHERTISCSRAPESAEQASDSLFSQYGPEDKSSIDASCWRVLYAVVVSCLQSGGDDFARDLDD